MERRDVVIVLIGALLVAGATAYAAVGGAPAPATTRAIVPASVTLPPPFPGPPQAVPTGYSASPSMSVPANASALHLRVWINATPAMAPGASARLEALAPNGTRYETEATAQQGDPGLALALDIAVATPALDVSVPAGSWNLSLAFSPGLAPAPAGTPYALESRAAAEVWTVVEVPAPSGK